jgi:RNA polymerase sigma factor (sigma-70 family)
MGGERPELSRPGGRGAPPADVAQLLRAAADGDQSAWDALVDRFSGLLWSICRSYGLGTADAADVFQLTWLRLLEHLDDIADPARLPGWLATTCRRECLAVLRHRRRTEPTGDERVLERSSVHSAGADEQTLVSARNAALWRAFGRLSRRCQQVLRVLVVQPADGPPSYEVAAAALDMPMGSLGPTRGRCLDQLRKLLDTEGITGSGAYS